MEPQAQREIQMPPNDAAKEGELDQPAGAKAEPGTPRPDVIAMQTSAENEQTKAELKTSPLAAEAPVVDHTEAQPTMDQVYQRIMSAKKEHDGGSSQHTASAASAGLSGLGGGSLAAALGSFGTSSANPLMLSVRNNTMEQIMSLMAGAAGGSVDGSALAALGALNSQLSLGGAMLPPAAAGVGGPVARSSTMENILRTISGVTSLDEGLLGWGSLPQERFIEGLTSDMREIDATAPEARAMRRTFTIERILSGGQGDLMALTKEAEDAGQGGVRLEGGSGVVSALVQAPQQGGPGMGVSALVKRAAMGLVEEPGPKRTRSGIALDLTAPRPPTTQELTTKLLSDTCGEASRLEAENTTLQAHLDTLLLQVDAVQQDNMRMKTLLLDGCRAQGVPMDLHQLNANIAHHRPAPLGDGPATHLAATALRHASGNVAGAVQLLIHAALRHAGGGVDPSLLPGPGGAALPPGSAPGALPSVSPSSQATAVGQAHPAGVSAGGGTPGLHPHASHTLSLQPQGPQPGLGGSLSNGGARQLHPLGVHGLQQGLGAGADASNGGYGIRVAHHGGQGLGGSGGLSGGGASSGVITLAQFGGPLGNGGLQGGGVGGSQLQGQGLQGLQGLVGGGGGLSAQGLNLNTVNLNALMSQQGGMMGGWG